MQGSSNGVGYGVLSRMVENGVITDFTSLTIVLCMDIALQVTYGTLLHGYATKDVLVEMYKLMDLMTSKSRGDEVMLVFSKLSLQGLRPICPNEVAYRILVDGLCKSGRVDDAMLNFEEMSNEGLTPGIVHKLHNPSRTCKSNLTDDALRMFQNLCLMAWKLETRTFHIMISALLKVGRNDEAMDSFAVLPANGLVPDDWT
uniref:Pentacotripeptide-repeat region of PRORP domain-containing protein n=1 Tax=Leersia perrieri TaxID=77586 RepID=A0A0D9XKX6_9ORYZ